MKLNTKVLIGIIFTWLVFLSLTYFGSRYLILNSYLNFETINADKNLSRIDYAIDQNNYSLYTFTADWSHWNDLYDYMLGKNPNFINNIDMTAFLTSNINLLTYWNTHSKLVVGAAVDLNNEVFISYPNGIERYIYPGSLLLNRKKIDEDIRGYILLPEGIMMVAAVVITDGAKSLPPIGIMITGRYITNWVMVQIQKATQLDVSVYDLNQINKSDQLKSVFTKLKNNTTSHFIRPINEDLLEGFSLIRDIYQNPIGMFRMQSPRPIYSNGLLTVRYFLAAFIVLGILFSYVLIVLLRALIVKRLEKLDKEVRNISQTQLFSKRIHVRGNDELAVVSKEINHLLALVQSSQEKLEDRVTERTRALQLTNEQLAREIDERKSVEEELVTHKEYLAKLAHYDTLTSLPNRLYFNETLDKMLKQALANQKKLAILFIDLDRFKPINDARGHQAGDVVLKVAAERINHIMRKGDVLARLGGDEFIIMLNSVDSRELISHFAERLLKSLSRSIVVHGIDFYVTASIGICIFPDDGVSLEDLQRNADMAMYKAKRKGGNTYHYFSADMHFEANEHIQLESEIRKALLNQELILYFQPKYYINTGIISGVEALIRWNHPKHGLISPLRFIPHAEQTGLILQIGEWVTREACRICKKWLDLGYQDIPIAINISAKQFHQQNIVQIVSDALKETNLPPNYLELEITESAVMDDIGNAIKKINDIKKMGVKVAIDDFGAGHASINYLKQFPVDVLKIDQIFIKGIPNNKNDIAITRAIIALAHNLNMKVVAEGVETVNQMHWLVEHECDIAQGYFLAKPMSAENLIREL